MPVIGASLQYADCSRMGVSRASVPRVALGCIESQFGLDM